MKNGSLASSFDSQPFILVKNGEVADISQPFFDATGFTYDELLNKSIESLFEILRVGPYINIYDINEKTDYFMFTKSYDVKMVNIQVIEKDNEKLFIFILKPYFSIDLKFPFINKLCADNYDGIAIFSLPDLTLLKANETYTSFFDEPFNKLNNCIGEKVSEFLTGFEGSTLERIWSDIIRTGLPFYADEYMYDRFKRGTTYWKKTLSPLYEEGKLKYCLEITKDITAQVIERKKLEEQEETIRLQNEQLKWQANLLDQSSEAIFTWKLDGGITYWNKGAEQLYGYSREEAIGKVSHDLLNTVHPYSIKNIQSILKSNGMWTGRVEHTCKDGRKVTVSTSHQIIEDNYGYKTVLEINRDFSEVKMMEDEIRQQKNELEEIIQSIDDAIFIYNGDKEFYLVNKAAKVIYKDYEFSNFENLNNNTPYLYFDENGHEITKDNLVVSRVSRGEVITNYKMSFKSDLETRHMSVNGRPVFDKRGNVKFIVISCRDITQDIETQRYVEQQKQQLEAIIENMSDNLMTFDKNGNYTIKNKAASLEMNGRKLEKVGDSYTAGMYFDLDGNEVPFNLTPAIRVLNGEKIVEQILQIKNAGEERYVGVSGVPLYDSNGEFSLGIVCSRDITEITKQNQEIKHQKELFEAVLNTMQESLYVIDKCGNYIVSNKLSKERLSASFNTIYDSYSSSIIYDSNGRRLAFEELPFYSVLKGETIKNKIYHHVVKGKEFHVVTSGTPILDEKGDIAYAVISTRDITEIIQREKELKITQEKLLAAELERNKTLQQSIEMKDEFLSLISHEFRTPLNVISTALQAINFLCENDLTDRLNRYLNTIKQNTFRQLRLVNNLLDITRADAGRIKIHKKNLDIVFLTNSIAHSVHTFASQKGIMVTVISSIEKKIIGIDEEKYERILLNLLSNAIKFTPEGNLISVKLRALKNKIQIEVKDNGIGIPKDKLEVIFERFGQVDSSLSRQAEGSGIGLSLVKKLVEALGGSITVKSRVGKGSSFIILLPDETVPEEQTAEDHGDLMDNRLVQVATVEFSDIYL